jgi:general secretion pathway protein M
MIEQFKGWWESITERERQLSALSGAFLLLAIIYWGVWDPLTTNIEANEKKLASSEQTLAWVEEKAGVLVQAGAGNRRVGLQPLTLQQIVSRSAKQFGIDFSRIESKSEQVEVVIADIEFDQFVLWLTNLSNQNFISVRSTDFSKIDPQGHIKVSRLVLAN